MSGLEESFVLMNEEGLMNQRLCGIQTVCRIPIINTYNLCKTGKEKKD